MSRSRPISAATTSTRSTTTSGWQTLFWWRTEGWRRWVGFLKPFAIPDATIDCANDKEFWHFWRPVTAIRSAGTDGNPATRADPGWTPLVVTPPNPDYPSGHTCRTAAQMTAYAHFFGRDNVSFSAFSVDSGTTRRFGGFSQATAAPQEAGRAS